MYHTIHHRNPRPLFPHLSELDQRGFRYYFQYTVLNNPRLLDRQSPPLDTAVKTFQELSDRIGPERVIWRYDPIIFSEQTGAQFHLDTYEHIAGALRRYTGRSVISILDIYGKIKARLDALRKEGLTVINYEGNPSPRFEEMMRGMVGIAQANGMEIVSCAEKLGLESLGIRPGKCVDDDYIKAVFGINVGGKKDPGQRAACGCVVSKDIGMYDSCLFGCQYCYATSSFERAKNNYDSHDPNSPSLIGRHEV